MKALFGADDAEWVVSFRSTRAQHERDEDGDPTEAASPPPKRSHRDDWLIAGMVAASFMAYGYSQRSGNEVLCGPENEACHAMRYRLKAQELGRKQVVQQSERPPRWLQAVDNMFQQY